jgi:hypothetical protein
MYPHTLYVVSNLCIGMYVYIFCTYDVHILCKYVQIHIHTYQFANWLLSTKMGALGGTY